MSAAGPPQGAKAPLGGSEPHVVGERGGDMSAAGPPQGAKAPAGGCEPHDVSERGGIHFVPGFPVMAWPMVEWVLDTLYPHRFATGAWLERSVIVFGRKPDRPPDSTTSKPLPCAPCHAVNCDAISTQPAALPAALTSASDSQSRSVVSA